MHCSFLELDGKFSKSSVKNFKIWLSPFGSKWQGLWYRLLTPGNSKLCTLEIQLKSPTQIEAKNKTHLMEIPHDFFLIAPENSNSTLGAMSPYPFCHAKYQSDVLGAWVSKNVFIMMFCVTKWFKRRPHFKRKNISKNKKSQCMHASFPFHHNALVLKRVFKFCLFVIRLQLSNYYGFCFPYYNRVT